MTFLRAIRRIFLFFLRITSSDITIKHHFTGDPFYLNTYLHKGYWFYGRKREKNTMYRFSEIIKPGMTVLEVGGHIGYLTSFFSYLAGENGKVIVFEPGKNNLQYLHRNIDNLTFSNVEVQEYAAGNEDSLKKMYLDPLTGQNNTLVENFAGFNENRKYSDQKNAEVTTDFVRVILLDDFLLNRKCPDFIKIDVEGFEWECVKGLKNTIENSRPAMMIEIQANEKEFYNYFKEHNYRIYNDMMQPLSETDFSHKNLTPNIFFLP